MAPILRGVCLIMHGKCLRAARGGGEAAEDPFCSRSLLQDSAGVCFDTCQLGHPVAHLELLSEYHSSSRLKESPRHKGEVIMRRGDCCSQTWIPVPRIFTLPIR